MQRGRTYIEVLWAYFFSSKTSSLNYLSKVSIIYWKSQMRSAMGTEFKCVRLIYFELSFLCSGLKLTQRFRYYILSKWQFIFEKKFFDCDLFVLRRTRIWFFFVKNSVSFKLPKIKFNISLYRMLYTSSFDN